MEKLNDLPVNDGKGLLDNIGLIDSLIVDCNSLPKLLFDGLYVGFCSTLVQMVQKLANLKKGVESDMKALEEQCKELKRVNDELAEQVYHVPTEKGE